MKIAWLAMAEGVGQDAKGAFTLIGVNQDVLGADTLPATTKRAVLAHLTLDEGEPLNIGDRLSFTFRVEGPSGKVISATSQVIGVGEPPPWPELPRTIDIPGQLVFSVEEYGEHRLTFEMTTPSSQKLTASVSVFVVSSATQMASKGGENLIEVPA
jgi:hypothetical protein